MTQPDMGIVEDGLKTEQCDTFYCDIFIAGDIAVIKQICRKHCLEVGLCVTVTPTDYIYTGGEETGAIIGLINYPRFPEDTHKIILKATLLGRLLMEGCYQKSYSITMPGKTIRYSREIGR